ncbi:MAG: LLM class flavin-dependent oxidoreductase, partial [Solirubrobacterales bacterium]|nr:LLM class flavin-dependent oxidoreductase [Solirubrobacterales bacterium]
MKVDVMSYVSSVVEAGRMAAEGEAFGYDGWWTTETQADPFLVCAVAAQATERIEIGTGIAVAFGRNPLTVALQSNDLQLLS